MRAPGLPAREVMDANPPVRPPAAIGSAGQTLPRSRSVLLLVDWINPLDFEGSEDIAPAALGAAKNTAAFKGRWCRRRLPVIYANDNYGAWRSDFEEVTQRCQERPGAAGEIARLMAPGEDDFTVLKPRHSAFYGTPLALLLAQMHVHRIVLSGLATDICVQLTAMDAFLRGYSVWVPSDCTASESPARTREALDYMARVLNVDTRPSTAWPAKRRHASLHGTPIAV